MDEIIIYGVNVKNIKEDLFMATIKGEYTEGDEYEFIGTLYEVYEQICASQGKELA